MLCGSNRTCLKRGHGRVRHVWPVNAACTGGSGLPRILPWPPISTSPFLFLEPFLHPCANRNLKLMITKEFTEFSGVRGYPRSRNSTAGLVRVRGSHQNLCGELRSTPVRARCFLAVPANPPVPSHWGTLRLRSDADRILV